MSCKIWACVNTTGGTGKTTLTAILASEIIRLGGSVALGDTDPNQPLLNWQDKFPESARLPVLLDDGPQSFGKREDAMEMGDGQNTLLARLDPLATDRALTGKLPRFSSWH